MRKQMMPIINRPLSANAQQIREQWKQLKPLDPYILDRPNISFLEGKKSSTACLQAITVGFTGLWLFLFAVSTTLLAPWPLDILRAPTGLITAFIFAVSVFMYRKRWLSEREYFHHGRLLTGVVQEFTHTGTYADWKDDAYYKVNYSFMTPENKQLTGENEGRHSQSAPPPIGRPVVILYVSDAKNLSQNAT